MLLVSFCIMNTHRNLFLERVVRQGCPLSSVLFVIEIGLLSSALQNDPSITGIQVGQKEIKTT